MTLNAKAVLMDFIDQILLFSMLDVCSAKLVTGDARCMATTD